MGTWNSDVCSNGAIVQEGTICGVTPKWNYACTSPGECGSDHNFENTAAACTGDCDANEHVMDTATFTINDHENLKEYWQNNPALYGYKKWRCIASSADGTKLVAAVEKLDIWTSIDSGATWTRRDFSSSNQQYSWHSIASSEDGTKLAAIAGHATFISDNSGETWEIDMGFYEPLIAIAMSADGTKLAVTAQSYDNNNNIYTSINGGADWTPVVVGTPGEIHLNAITMSADGTKLAVTVWGGNIWTSSNSGATWTEDTGVGATKQWAAIASSADGTRLAAVASPGRIWISTNSGATWVERIQYSPIMNWASIAMSEDGTKLVAVEDGGNIWTSSSSGVNWRTWVVGNSTNNWAVIHRDTATGETIYGSPTVALSADGTKMVAAAYEGYIWSGFIGLQCIACPTGYLRYVGDSIANGETVCTPTCDENEHVKNSILEPSLTDMVLPRVSLYGSQYPVPWVGITSSADGTTLAVVPGWPGGNIWTSSNSGATWTERVVGDGTNSWSAITSSTYGTRMAAVAYGGYIYTSSNSGTSWTSTGAIKNWYGITSSADGTKLAAVVNGGNIFISDNSGATWEEVTVGDGTKQWKGIASSADGTKLAAAGGDDNLWTCNGVCNSGANWEKVTVGDGTNNWYSITSSADGNKLAATANGGSIWTSSGSSWTERVVGVGVKGGYSMTSSTDGTKLGAVVHGKLWTSSDSGRTWTERVVGDGTQHWSAITSSADGTKISVADEYGQIWSGDVGLQCTACPIGYIRAAGDWVDDGETECTTQAATCTVPTVDTAMGTWNGNAFCSNGASVTAGMECTIDSASGYVCTSPGVCGTNGQFENTAVTCTAMCTVPTIDPDTGTWNGEVCSNGAIVPVNTICELTPEAGYNCVNAGTCGTNGQFGNYAYCTEPCNDYNNNAYACENEYGTAKMMNSLDCAYNTDTGVCSAAQFDGCQWIQDNANDPAVACAGGAAVPNADTEYYQCEYGYNDDGFQVCHKANCESRTSTDCSSPSSPCSYMVSPCDSGYSNDYLCQPSFTDFYAVNTYRYQSAYMAENCPLKTNPLTDPCNYYTDSSDCVNAGGCDWVDDTSTCSAQPPPTGPPTGPSDPCNANTDMNSCSMASSPSCQWDYMDNKCSSPPDPCIAVTDMMYCTSTSNNNGGYCQWNYMDLKCFSPPDPCIAVTDSMDCSSTSNNNGGYCQWNYMDNTCNSM